MPLNIEYASTAQCRPDHVWQVFEQIELWPRWDPQAISQVEWVSGDPWTKGAKFSIKLLKPMPFTLTPEVLEVESPIYVHLRGEGSGVIGEQHYIFKWMPDSNATELRTLQQFSGAPIMFFGNSVKPGIEAGIKHLFARVIEEAESLARSEAMSVPGLDVFTPVGDSMSSSVDPASSHEALTPPESDPDCSSHE